VVPPAWWRGAADGAAALGAERSGTAVDLGRALLGATCSTTQPRSWWASIHGPQSATAHLDMCGSDGRPTEPQYSPPQHHARLACCCRSPQQRAAEVDRLFQLSLGAEGSGTIGGNLSTNAGGTTALAYGVAREMALGWKVVAGRRARSNGLSKLKKTIPATICATSSSAPKARRHHYSGDLKAVPKPVKRLCGLQSPAQA